MDYKFEIGGGQTRRWSETAQAHFNDWPDSLGLRMSKQQTIEMMARMAKRLANNPALKNDEMMPTLGYSGKIEEDTF